MIGNIDQPHRIASTKNQLQPETNKQNQQPEPATRTSKMILQQTLILPLLMMLSNAAPLKPASSQLQISEDTAQLISRREVRDPDHHNNQFQNVPRSSKLDSLPSSVQMEEILQPSVFDMPALVKIQKRSTQTHRRHHKRGDKKESLVQGLGFFYHPGGKPKKKKG